MKKLLFLSLFVTFFGFAQTPTIEPAFFAADDEITITYDVSGTSLQSLQEAWIWMWLPGKGIDAPSNINPASSNTSVTNPAKFTRSTTMTGGVLFSITLTPTTFFNQTASEIESIGMLLKGNDWSNGQTEDNLVEISDGFTLVLENPTGNFGFYETSQEITISAITSESASIDLFVDGVLAASETNATSLSQNHTIIDDGLVHELKVTASNGAENAEKTYTYTLEPTTSFESLPASTVNGINYLSGTSATLVLEAPNKSHVFVIGDFNDWKLDADFLMKKDGDQFWLTITGLTPGKEYLYQYLVDGEIKIADPYAEKISSQFDDGEIIAENRYPNLLTYPASQTSEAVSYLQTNQQDFVWAAFNRPAKENLIIYELLIRDFTDERTFDAVTARLDYLQDLGVNAIELMPVQEFEGNISWGYNPSSMFAVDKYYGTELDLKTLINEAHKRGMAVIFDIVLNHQFGRNSLVRLYNEGLYGKPTSDNPWFNIDATHDFNVGYDMNHESTYTLNYSDRVIQYWLEEYNIDGYRFDLSKGFTQKVTIGNVGAWGSYDATRVATWKRYADVIWATDPTAYIILEHFADNVEEKELANYGMMLWGSMNGPYRSIAKGNSTSLSWLYHESRGWNDPHVVGYMESHDEERLVWDAIESGFSLSKSLDRAKLAAAFFLPVPGPKMIWQFGEMGYDEELNDDRLGIKPTHWEYLDDEERARLFNLYKSLINLRTKTSYISSEYFEWNTSSEIKTINVTHPDVEIYIIGNFDHDDFETGNHKFSKTGTWYDYFTGNEIQVEDVDAEVTLAPTDFAIYTSKLIENYVEDVPVILSSEPKPEVIVFPNPTQDLLNFSTNKRITNLKVQDLSGKVVLQVKQSSTHQVDLSKLRRGVYSISFEIEGQRHIEKIIKE